MTCAAAALALALAVSVLAGCTGGDPAPPQTSAPASSPTTSTTMSTPPTASTTSTTSAGPAFPAGLPETAKTNDKAGAEAFAKFFFDSVNQAWVKADPNPLDSLCRFEVSKSCTALRDTARDLKTKKQHYDGAPVAVEKVSSLGAVGGQHRVLFAGRQLQRSIVDDRGHIVSTDQLKSINFVFYLEWGATGWIVSDLKLAS